MIPLPVSITPDPFPEYYVNVNRDRRRRQDEHTDPPVHQEQIRGNRRHAQDVIDKMDHVPDNEMHTLLGVVLEHHHHIPRGRPGKVLGVTLLEMGEQIPPDVQGIPVHQVMVLCIDKEIEDTGKHQEDGKDKADPEERAKVLVIDDLIYHDPRKDGRHHSQCRIEEPSKVKHDEILLILLYVF